MGGRAAQTFERGAAWPNTGVYVLNADLCVGWRRGAYQIGIVLRKQV
jgi:hypothetical protein